MNERKSIILRDVHLRENALTKNVYLWMILGLAITAGVSYLSATSVAILRFIYSNPLVTIAIFIVFFWDHWTAATVGVVAMTFGDGFGSIVGRRFGRHRTINGKSLEGSLGVFAATAVMASAIILLYGWLYASGLFPNGGTDLVVPFWAAAAVAGLAATVLEAVCPGQYDNIVTPIVVALTMVMLGL